MDLLIGILGAGIGSGLMAILLAAIQRHWSKSDKHDSKLDAIVNGVKILTVDRVHYLGSVYIKRGSITLDEKETLDEMHEAYKSLGGNGHLDTVMASVDRLPISDGGEL